MKNKAITMIELVNLKANNDLMPKRISIMWLDYKVEYYLEENFWYRENLPAGKMLEIKPNQLNVRVEILPEENDEWEDIEELNYTLPTKHEHGKLFYKDGHNNTLRQIDITVLEKINRLIKNQKYLKEKLDNYDRKD